MSNYYWCWWQKWWWLWCPWNQCSTVLLECPYLKSQHNEAVNKWFLEFVIFILIPEHCQWKASIDTKLDSKGTELSVHIMVKIASIDVHIIEQGTVWSCCGKKLTDNKQKYVIIFYCRE